MNRNYNFQDELNSIDCRLNNLIYRLRYKKWIEKIIEFEKIGIKVKQNLTITDYIKQIQELNNDKKKKILSNWECGYKPVIQTNWIEEKLDLKKLESFIKNNSDIIEKKFDIHLLKLNLSSNSIDGFFLGIKPKTFQFIRGKIQETQPTFYIYLRYSNVSNIIQFRTSVNIGKFRAYIISGVNQIYRNCKLDLNKAQIMSLANEAFARNAKIQCEGEEIHERGFAVPENKDLFSISEFINLVKKKNYIIRKIFVTLSLKNLKSPYNQVSLRIFPGQGKFSFTGLVNEEQIRETLNVIQKIRISSPKRGKYRLMDEFFNQN